MDKIVKLQNCSYVDITKSPKLIERWNEMEEENQKLPMIMQTSPNRSTDYWKERDRLRRVALLCGVCKELDSSTNELIHHPSISIPLNTTLAVISLLLDEAHLLQQAAEMADERAKKNCEGQLRIIYVSRKCDGWDAANEEDKIREILEALTMLPQCISYAIPSTDTRRLSLIGRTIFDNSDVFNDGTGPELLFFMADIREGDRGRQMFKDENYVTGDQLSKQSKEKVPVSDEEIDISDGIAEFINCVCESQTQNRSEQCSRLQEENMVEDVVQKLKNNNIHHFGDNEVKVDHLQGKTVAIILIDQNYPECKRLQQIYEEIKLKDSNFEAIWIPEEEVLGIGTYSRAIQHMPWLTIPDPNLIKFDKINDKSPRIIMINRGGSIQNPNALSHLMSWGADACPFTKGSLSQLDLKSSLEILFHATEIKEPNKKVIFLYAEPPNQKLKMKCTLEKLVQIHGKGNYEILYVGRLFAGRNVAENVEKAYEEATESMNWTKLSFDDMMTFWYRCKYLSDEMVKETNSASTLKGLLKALLNEERWLVMVDGDRMVTANGIDVVEMACEFSDDEVEIVVEELKESLKDGKCREQVRRYFRDELHHPGHQHPLCVPMEKGSFYCAKCYLSSVYASHGKRLYRCEECDWNLCWDCWKEFMRRHATDES